MDQQTAYFQIKSPIPNNYEEIEVFTEERMRSFEGLIHEKQNKLKFDF